MSSVTKDNVEYSECVGIRTGNIIRSKGFSLASIRTGIVMKEIEDIYGFYGIGILKEDPNVKPKYLLGIFKRKIRRELIGNIWFGEPKGSSQKGKKWLFEVYGTDNIDPLKQLAGDLADALGVKIEVVLESGRARYEVFESEFGY